MDWWELGTERPNVPKGNGTLGVSWIKRQKALVPTLVPPLTISGDLGDDLNSLTLSFLLCPLGIVMADTPECTLLLLNFVMIAVL